MCERGRGSEKKKFKFTTKKIHNKCRIRKRNPQKQHDKMDTTTAATKNTSAAAAAAVAAAAAATTKAKQLDFKILVIKTYTRPQRISMYTKWTKQQQ